MTDVISDFADPESFVRDDLRDLWAHLREHQPVLWHRSATGRGFWVLTRYRDVRSVCQDYRKFTSTNGIRLDGSREAVEAARSVDLLVTDPPHHTVMRKAFSAHLGPRSIGDLAETARGITRELVQAALFRHEFDFIEAVSKPVATRVICLLMGVPEPDREGLSATIERALGSAGQESIGQAQAELYVYSFELVQSCRGSLSQQILARLIREHSDVLTEQELVMNVHGLFLAATETVRHAAAGGLLAMIEWPEQWRRLKAFPELLPSAIEEILRWSSPAMHLLRTATQEVSIGGKLIRPGDEVTAWLPSANDDEEVFRNPREFDVGRRPNRHLAFGAGQHFCVGSHIARLQLRSIFEELLTQAAGFELAGEPRRLRSNRIHGIERLPVRPHL